MYAAQDKQGVKPSQRSQVIKRNLAFQVNQNKQTSQFIQHNLVIPQIHKRRQNQIIQMKIVDQVKPDVQEDIQHIHNNLANHLIQVILKHHHQINLDMKNNHTLQINHLNQNILLVLNIQVYQLNQQIQDNRNDPYIHHNHNNPVDHHNHHHQHIQVTLLSHSNQANNKFLNNQVGHQKQVIQHGLSNQVIQDIHSNQALQDIHPIQTYHPNLHIQDFQDIHLSPPNQVYLLNQFNHLSHLRHLLQVIQINQQISKKQDTQVEQVFLQDLLLHHMKQILLVDLPMWIFQLYQENHKYNLKVR